jgi:hypothetical protein
MSRTRKVIRCLAPALLVAAAVAPSASASLDSAMSQSPADSRSADQRTATELGQAVGEPSDAGATQLATRTATELGQTVAGSAGSSVAQADRSPQAPAGESGGFDWGDVALVAGGLAILIAIAGAVLLAQRRGTTRRSRAPATSS